MYQRPFENCICFKTRINYDFSFQKNYKGIMIHSNEPLEEGIYGERNIVFKIESQIVKNQ